MVLFTHYFLIETVLKKLNKNQSIRNQDECSIFEVTVVPNFDQNTEGVEMPLDKKTNSIKNSCVIPDTHFENNFFSPNLPYLQ